MTSNEVKAFVDVLQERLSNTLAAFARLEGQCNGNTQAHADLKSELDKTLPRLKDLIEELKKWKEEETKEVETYVHLKRDVKDLLEWKVEMKEDAKEMKKWYRTFGPTVLALGGTTLVNLIILGINLYFAYWVKKPTP